jgi:hypothetical protein
MTIRYLFYFIKYMYLNKVDDKFTKWANNASLNNYVTS